MHLGTLFVLVGFILFLIAMFVSSTGWSRGWFGPGFLVALAGAFTAFGVLLGAPALIHH